MRERAQASVETIALTAAVVALASALLLGVVRLGPPLASTLGQTLSQVFAPGQQKAPGLDGLERLLLAGATGAGADGPTLLDVRIQLRSHLDRRTADDTFAAILRPLVSDALAGHSIELRTGRIGVVDRATEDTWLHDRFHPGRLQRSIQLAVELAGPPGAVYSLATDAGAGAREPVDGVEPGRAAGDVVVRLQGGTREVVLRRQPETGLTVVADRLIRPFERRW
jgi:hypothetical protein